MISVQGTFFIGGLFLIVLVVSVLLVRVRIVYPVVFAPLALALAWQPWVRLNVVPDVLMALLVPPLLFPTALSLNRRHLWLDWMSVLTVGVGATLLTAWAVAGVMSYTVWFDWASALLLGVILVAMEPAAIRQVMQMGSAPRRLASLAEGEHLLAALMALVLLPVWVTVTVGEVRLVGSLPEYIRDIGGGVGVGILIGALAVMLLARDTDPLVTLGLSVAAAYGSYLLAAFLQANGALASVVAGTICGTMALPKLHPTSRVALSSFWEFAAFVATAFAFLVAGLTLSLTRLPALWTGVVLAAAVALVARLVTLYVLGLIRRGLGCTIPPSFYYVVALGGTRGGVAVLLILSLPAALFRQEEVQVVAFGALVLLAVVQGLLGVPLLAFFRLARRPAIYVEYERLLARLLGVRAARQQLSRMYQEGIVAPHSWETIDAELGQQEMVLLESVQDFTDRHPEVQRHSLLSVRREALRAQQHVLANLSREGIISTRVATDLIGELEQDLEQINEQEADLPLTG